jgi:GNAT superfamily N-acetyltransferase
MEIKTFTRNQLRDFVDSAAYAAMQVLPISRQRAYSQMANPRAGEEDVLLIIAFSEGRMAGYLGLLPDSLLSTAGVRSPISWMSCIWTDPRLRGQGVAKKLVQTALDVTGNRLLATSYTPAAKKLYDRMGAFADLASMSGTRYYRKAASRPLLAGRWPTWTHGLLGLADSLANGASWPLRAFAPRLPADLHWRFAGRLGPEAAAFVEKHQGRSLLGRTAEELKWMINHPWLLVAAADEDSRRYHFSSVAQSFTALLVELRKGDQLMAVLHLVIREGHCKLPHAWLEEGSAPWVAAFVRFLWHQYDVHTATVYQADILRAMGKGPWFRRPFRREWLISCGALSSLPHGSFFLHPGEGDEGFL